MAIEITEEDKQAIEPILESLEVNWWVKEAHRNALALAHATGRVMSTKNDWK